MTDHGFIAEGDDFIHPKLCLRVMIGERPHYGRPWVIELPYRGLVMRGAGTIPRRYLSAPKAMREALEELALVVDNRDLVRLGFVKDGHGYASDRLKLYINHAGQKWIAGGGGRFLRSPGGVMLTYPTEIKALAALIKKGWVD